MKNKLFQNFETIATILWLIMDFAWLCKYDELSFIISIPAILLMFISCIICKEINETFSMNATLCWLLMNSLWIYSEISGEEMYLNGSKAAFVLSLVCIFISINISKKGNKNNNFKRLKIK